MPLAQSSKSFERRLRENQIHSVKATIINDFSPFLLSLNLELKIGHTELYCFRLPNSIASFAPHDLKAGMTTDVVFVDFLLLVFVLEEFSSSSR